MFAKTANEHLARVGLSWLSQHIGVKEEHGSPPEVAADIGGAHVVKRSTEVFRGHIMGVSELTDGFPKRPSGSIGESLVLVDGDHDCNCSATAGQLHSDIGLGLVDESGQLVLGFGDGVALGQGAPRWLSIWPS